MVTIRLKGHVTVDGDLVFEQPADLPPGEVDIIIEIADAEDFTDEEIHDLLTFTPRSGAEVVADGLTGGWEDLNIQDPVAWVEAQRRKQQERRKW